MFIPSIDVTGRKLAELQSEKQLARIGALRKIDIDVSKMGAYIADGKISEHYTRWDKAGLIDQLQS